MPSIEPSKLQVVPTELPALKIPDSLNYRKVCRIRIPSKDIFLKWCLPELLATISAETLAEIHKIWEERNIIDVAIKGETAAMDLSQNLAEVLRWHLRGMSVDFSVWKVRVDLINLMLIRDAEKAKNRRLNQVIQGFRVGSRVILSNQVCYRQEMIGWKGVVTDIRSDYCLVQFDLDPKEVNGGDKKWQFTYDYLSIVPPELPKLKLKQELKSTPSPIIEAKMERRQDLPKPIIKAKSFLQSRDSKYTAIELAAKLNVSRAKIYQMRSSGMLEAAGYRAESNGRSLLFMAIDCH
jgi:hypothetical protein